MSEESQPDHQPGRQPRRQAQDRVDSPVDYSPIAAHGWEFLLDNHLEAEAERSKAIRHAAVLGEN